MRYVLKLSVLLTIQDGSLQSYLHNQTHDILITLPHSELLTMLFIKKIIIKETRILFGSTCNSLLNLVYIIY